MITCKTKKWGNSLGIIIPKEEVDELQLQEDQQIVIEITKINNPFQELFGFGKNNPITKKEFLENRRLLEGKK